VHKDTPAGEYLIKWDKTEKSIINYYLEILDMYVSVNQIGFHKGTIGVEDI